MEYINQAIKEKLTNLDKLKPLCQGKKAYVATFGCQANVRDGEIIEGILVDSGFILVQEMETADLILFNTCAIRKMAENRVIGELGRAKHLKKMKEVIIALCGCMAQEKTNIDFFTKQQLIDIIFGPNTIATFPDLLLKHLQEKTKLIAIADDENYESEFLNNYRQSNYKAFVHVMKGCERFCSYCIVPYVRGKEISRSLDNILMELNDLVNRGFKQVCLVGQNVNAYGKNLNPPLTFSALLKEVVKLPFLRVSFITSNVYDFTDELIALIKKEDKIIKHIHLPLQSGDDQVLKQMNRAYNVQEYITLYNKLRNAVPDIAITTDIIVGFPSEVEESFNNTYDLCAKLRFDSAYTFLFSPRPNTPAAQMVDNVDVSIKKQRLYRLNELINECAKEKNQLLIDTIQQVLIESREEKEDNLYSYSGYDHHNKLIHFTSNCYFLEGTIVAVKVIAARAWSLSGELDFKETALLLSKQINTNLKNNQIIKQLDQSRLAIVNDQDLTKLQEKIIKVKKALVHTSLEQQEQRTQLLKEKEELEKQYLNNPLIINYRHLFDLFVSLSKEIEYQLKIS